MAWDMLDYPASLKNLEPLVKKKTIEIANALLADGYPEDRAIPIATSQAEKWYAAADEKEKAEFKQAPDPQKNDFHKKDDNAPKLLTADVLVKYRNDVWEVLSVGAKRASDTYSNKEEAIKRGKEIATNKQSTLRIYKKDGTLQATHNYKE